MYTESEQVCKFIAAVPLGITHSKQLCLCKPAKNEYTNVEVNLIRAQHIEKWAISFFKCWNENRLLAQAARTRCGSVTGNQVPGLKCQVPNILRTGLITLIINTSAQIISNCSFRRV